MRGAPPGRSGARVLAALLLTHAVAGASNATVARPTEPGDPVPAAPRLVPAAATGISRDVKLPVSTCIGSSTQLPQDQCDAWGALYDATNGPAWLKCSDTKTDPCACAGTYEKDPVCNKYGPYPNTSVTHLYVRASRPPRVNV